MDQKVLIRSRIELDQNTGGELLIVASVGNVHTNQMCDE